MLSYEPLAKGRLVCVVPKGHPLAERERVSAADIARHPLIGIDPNDPYGRIMANIFREKALAYEVAIKARFGSTVGALVTNGLGIAVIDEFTALAGHWPGLEAIPIVESTEFETYIAARKDATLSSYCEYFIAALRGHMEALRAPARPGRAKPPRSAPAK
jgi:DNA-binding transcriptional LysR family regulator